MQQIVVDLHLLASSCLCPRMTDFKVCWMDFLSSLILWGEIKFSWNSSVRWAGSSQPFEGL
jgi:hypothetical protein